MGEMTGKTYVLRDATLDDLIEVVRLVRELAVYERLAHEMVATELDFASALFGSHPRAFAMLAEVDGKPVGLALWFYNFSTFLGRHGIYVEDVFVDPAYRGLGIGKAFFVHLARRAVAENCGRMEWAVLDWNTLAIDFYKKMGAQAMQEWTVQRLTGSALAELAAKG